MVASLKNATQYTSEQFVESCGAILFDLTASQTKKVCLVHYHAKDEWLLAKGRRNCGESRREAALREVFEETGYKAHLHPVTMRTRAPPIDEQEHMPDEPRSYENITEPFMVTMRQLSDEGGNDVKIIWWYIAVLDKDSLPSGGGEEQFAPAFFPLQQALEKLSFPNDRMVLQRAIDIVEAQ